jgi:hypothetical protein
MKNIVIVIAAILLGACSTFQGLPQSIGEKDSGFTYIPLDPLPVVVTDGPECKRDWEKEGTPLLPGYKLRAILDSLPDNAVRIAIKEYDAKGKLAVGAASIGTEGKRYQVILDYINVDTANIRFFINSSLPLGAEGPLEIKEVTRIDRYVDPDQLKGAAPIDIERANGNIVIPVYVGVGLRLTADLQVIRGSINLSSLGAIAAGVEAGRASGSLVVQTLGVTGKQVSTSLPLPSELNQTTVQNAILSLGSIKAIIYDSQSTTITPRVTGIYLPMKNGTEELVNRIVSELARSPIPWPRPCVRVTPDAVAADAQPSGTQPPSTQSPNTQSPNTSAAPDGLRRR